MRRNDEHDGTGQATPEPFGLRGEVREGLARVRDRWVFWGGWTGLPGARVASMAIAVLATLVALWAVTGLGLTQWLLIAVGVFGASAVDDVLLLAGCSPARTTGC